MQKTILAVFLVLSLALSCCAPREAIPVSSAKSSAPSSAPPAAKTPSIAESKTAEPAHRVYRLDFVLSAKDAAANPPGAIFTMNLEDDHSAEVLLGKNVALAASPTQASPPRQDVGVKVWAHARRIGDDLLLEVSTELTSFDPPSTIHKIVARGDALAAFGKSTLIVSLGDREKQYELSVTPTPLR